MRSTIYESERLPNKNRKFGAALDYYPAMLDTDGVAGDIPLLFTADDINKAMARAAKNPEDMPPARGFWAAFWRWWTV